MTSYYNEHDPFAAAWLRELITAGCIAPGDVDTRSIEDVSPDDLRPYTQCHFFAGIGVWSCALRRAGWPDDRPVWTGSCPCQPFSAAGKGGGFDDERHLWPAWHWLIEQCQPAIVFGEQVASKAVEPWLDLVHADLEALGYAFGTVPFPSAGVGAPHIRDRLYWLADADDARPQRRLGVPERADQRPAGADSVAGGLADAGRTSDERVRGPGEASGAPGAAEIQAWEWERGGATDRSSGASGGLADAAGQGRRYERQNGDPTDFVGEVLNGASQSGRGGADDAAGPVNGLWRDADWLFCRDGRWRPVEPGTFPLAHGAPARVGRLRGYGNAINAEAATAWIESYLEAIADDGRDAGITLSLEEMLE